MIPLCIHMMLGYMLIKQLPIKLDWKEGDIVDITDNKYNSAEGAAWVRYRDNGKAKSSCGGCNNGVGLNFECHF